MDPDPEKKRKEGMIRDFLSRWGRVATVEKGVCRACGSRLVSDDQPCPVCGIPTSLEGIRPPPPPPSPENLSTMAPPGKVPAGPPREELPEVPPPEPGAPAAPAREPVPPDGGGAGPTRLPPPPEVPPAEEAPAVPAPMVAPPAAPPPVTPVEVPPAEEPAPPPEPSVPAPAGRAGQHPHPSPEKVFLPSTGGMARCSACNAGVLPEATICPGCGARFLPRAGHEGVLRKIELPPERAPVKPAERLRALKDAVIAGGCPACGTPVGGGLSNCPLCGTKLGVRGELENARQIVVESVQKQLQNPPPPERPDGCPACQAPIAPGAAACLVCGTALGGSGVRQLARPFEPVKEEGPRGAPAKERTGEDLQISKGEKDWQAWLVQADIYYNSGQTAKALEAYDTSLKIRESYEAYNNKGLVLYREGRLEDSLACFDKALERQKDDEFIWYNRGNAFRDLGRFSECISSYDKAISLKPDFEKAWVASGAALLAQGRNEEAVICFEAALKINWNNEQTWHAIGNAMFRMRRHEEAETILSKAVEIRPDFWQAWYDKAELAIEMGNVKEAVSALRKVTENNPGHWQGWLELGGLLADLGEEKEALACYGRAAELNPESWEAWRALGHEYFSLKRYEDACRCFGRATRLNSHDGGLWLEAAECFYLTGRPDDAIRAVEKALEQKETPQAWLSKGIAFATLGRTKEALECFEKGIALDRTSPRLWFELAATQRLLGEMDKAISGFDRAIELNPAYEKALASKGRLLMELRRTREALDLFDRAVAIRPSLEKLESIAELRQALIITEAAREKEPPAPLPAAAQLSAEEVFKLGMALGAAGAPAPAEAPEAPGGPVVAVEEPGALPPEPVPGTEGHAAAGVPVEVPDVTAAEGPAPAGGRPGPVSPEAAAFAPAPAPPAGPPAPLEFEPVERPLVSRPPAERAPAGAGLAAAAHLANGRGLINGRGLTNGRGLVNGRSLTNGFQVGRGMTNGKGLVNGRSLVNGAGLINGRGIVNGRSLINGNGVVNGRGFVNGRPGGEEGPYAAYRRRARRGPRLRFTAGVLAAAFLVLAIPFFAIQFGGYKGIQIDGDLADWEGVASYTDAASDQTAEPSVNLQSYATVSERGWAYFRVQTEGRILAGTNDGVDSVRIFIDTDQSAGTGYRIAGIGADRMLDIWGFGGSVRGAPVSAFNASRNPYDWNGWEPSAEGRASARGSGLESGVPFTALGMRDGGRYLASILLEDGRGDRDGSDSLISNERGAITLEQEGLAPAEITNLSAALPLLRVNVTCQGGEVTLAGMVLEPLGETPDRPTGLAHVSVLLDTNRDGLAGADDPLLALATLSGGAFREVLSSPLLLRPGSRQSLLVMGEMRPDAPVGAPAGVELSSRELINITRGAATLHGAGRVGFVFQMPARIIIDGSFDDWAPVTMHNDSEDAANPDIDIIHYASSADRQALSFYLGVRGRMLGGTDVPAPSRARPSKPGPIEPLPPEAPLPLPVVTGEDTAVVFIDADRNSSTGIPLAGVGADFAIQVFGRTGAVLSSAFYRAGAGGNWTPGGPAAAAVAGGRLETQVSLEMLGMSAAAVDVVMYATDWTGHRDYTPREDGRGGRLQASARDIAPAALTRGTGWPMLALTLTATGGMADLWSVEVQLLGDAAGPDAPAAYLFLDNDSDGRFSGADLLLTGSGGNYSGRNYRCAPLYPVIVPEGCTRLVFIVLEISSAAAPGKTAGLSITGASSLGTGALETAGAFPANSSTPSIVAGGGRALDDTGDGDTLPVSFYVPKEKVSGDFDPGRGASGRAPSGGWPTSWTTVANDSSNSGKPDELDLRKINMTDDGTYIYFQLDVQDLSSLAVNDEWNIYFKTNDSSTNRFDMWYRLTLQVTDASTPEYSSSLSSYIGNANPPDRDNTWTANESHTGTGNSSDQTAYGYLVDGSTTMVQFYVKKSALFGNLIAPGNTTRVYADTWYTDNKNRWKKADRSPNNGTKGYTMIPEFGEMLAPAAGIILIFSILRRNRGGRRLRRAEPRGRPARPARPVRPNGPQARQRGG